MASSDEDEMDDRPSEEDMREIFDSVSEDGKFATFEAALELDGIDGILEEEAISVEDLGIVWGDEPLDFKGFSDWYNEVLDMYDDFLEFDAVKPPTELMLEDEGAGVGSLDALDTDDLLSDISAVNKTLGDIFVENAEAKQARATKAVKTSDDVEDTAATGVAVDDSVAIQPSVQSTTMASTFRTNAEITRLFRETCDEENLLDFEGVQLISEIQAMISDGELAIEELEEFWAGLPKQRGDRIDVLTFKNLLAMIDDLFEDVQEEEAKEKKKKPKPRSPDIVKDELLGVIDGLLQQEDKNLGLGGRRETDNSIKRLCSELERSYRNKLGKLERFDAYVMCGDWELLYTTSAKMRSWGSVLNSGRLIKDANMTSFVERFSLDAKDVTPAYDLEELFESEGQELGMRGLGSWLVSTTPNVVTGDEDLRIKLQINQVEYDKADGGTGYDKVLKSVLGVPCRTYCYSFLMYVDMDIRITRTSLTGDLVNVYKRMEPPEPLLLQETATADRDVEVAKEDVKAEA